MQNTTLCYILKGEDCLLLHRNKKENDINEGKWVGVGGKMEEGESPEEGILREVTEETGLTLTQLRYRGIVTFVSDRWGWEFIHLFTGHDFTGELISCDEGTLCWRPFTDLFTLPRWAGDDIFLRLIQEDRAFFSLKLTYQGETLVEAKLDNQPLPLECAPTVPPEKEGTL